MYRVLFLVILLPLILVGCGNTTPEDEIRERIREMELAAEARERIKLATMISSDYKDERDNNAEDIRKMAAGIITRYRNIHLVARVKDVTMANEDEGTARVMMGMLSQQDDDNLPLPMIRTDLYLVSMTLRNETTGWNLLNADWERASPEDLLD